MNLDKFLGCIYAGTIGDRIGMPAEKMTACDIRARFGEIRDFVPGSRPSDDSQLTFATMDAFIDSRGLFQMSAIAAKHIEAHENEWEGWGRSTRKSCARLKDGEHWTKSGEPDGAGNGVIMKISPFGLWHSITREDIGPFLEKCVEFAKMTHLGTPAITAGAVHAVAISTLALRREPFVHVPTLLTFLYELALNLEAELPPWKDTISAEIMNIMTYIDYGRRGNLQEQTPENIAYLFGGGTSYAPCSFGLSYAIFARSACNPDNPEPFDAVFDAVHAGGDTDTNATIVGSLIGALHGMHGIPQRLIDALDDKDEICERTGKFFAACSSASRLY